MGIVIVLAHFVINIPQQIITPVRTETVFILFIHVFTISLQSRVCKICGA